MTVHATVLHFELCYFSVLWRKALTTTQQFLIEALNIRPIPDDGKLYSAGFVYNRCMVSVVLQERAAVNREGLPV